MREAGRRSGYMPLSGTASGRPLMINSVSRRGHRQILLATFSSPKTAFPQLKSPFQATRRRNLSLTAGGRLSGSDGRPSDTHRVTRWLLLTERWLQRRRPCGHGSCRAAPDRKSELFGRQPRCPQSARGPRREQIKKYSTASKGLMNGMFTFTCMLIALFRRMLGDPWYQLYEAGKNLSTLK